MYTFVSRLVSVLKKVIPEPVVALFRKPYHFLLALSANLAYGFPAKKLIVIGVTGTKGKSTVTEMLYSIFTAAGKKTALVSTIRFVTPNSEEPNLLKMTMQGRGFLQHMLARAKKEGATHAIVEITSEGVLEWRHKFLSLNGLIVTNIQKEHIERHGSFENYAKAKRAILSELEQSKKQKRVFVGNADDVLVKQFLNEAKIPEIIEFSEKELEGSDLHIPLPGVFNKLNALAAIKMAEAFGVAHDSARDALTTMPQVKGRLEPVIGGQDFDVYVDYAHTPDSLEALYGVFPNKRKVCVLGNTGGGRDTWKRPLMGAIADKHCDAVILTNEDPYDEDPEKIIADMAIDMKKQPHIILDRRKAIAFALSQSRSGDVILISGKGTDPYIMEAHGKKLPWSDTGVVTEELQKFMKTS